MAVAEESKGAKRQIYLEYATDLFRKIGRDFSNTDEAYPPILEESEYGLAQCALKANRDQEADRLLAAMIEKYGKAKITRGYYLSRSWNYRAMIAARQGNRQQALTYLDNADDTGKGKILSADERLDLWIQQALILREENQMDKAMLGCRR